jgi:hypothetical protein
MGTLSMGARSIHKGPAAAGELRRYRERWRRNGYVLGPVILSAKEIEVGVAAIDAVMAGRYETGTKPVDAWWSASYDPRRKLRKIDQPHVANRALYRLITKPKLAQWLAALVGARRLQVWAAQILFKPGSGDAEESLGWHQDYAYWQGWWTPHSNVFTCWLALSDVGEDSGPVTYVRGSHRWGLIDLSMRQVEKSAPALMPAGAFSVHHRLTVHGSPPNFSGRPRYALAIHLATEKATATPGNGNPWMDSPGYDYVGHLDDPAICPVVYPALEKRARTSGRVWSGTDRKNKPRNS